MDLSARLPGRILDAADAGYFEMVVSRRLLAELTDVLSRQRLCRYGPIEHAEAHVRRAMRAGVYVEIEGEPERVVPGDPKDDYLVALARASGADYLVSGDPLQIHARLRGFRLDQVAPGATHPLLRIVGRTRFRRHRPPHPRASPPL